MHHSFRYCLLDKLIDQIYLKEQNYMSIDDEKNDDQENSTLSKKQSKKKEYHSSFKLL